ncbi:MAG: hypothetical protein AAF633_12125, partial [Chloroflexota bacterium]
MFTTIALIFSLLAVQISATEQITGTETPVPAPSVPLEITTVEPQELNQATGGVITVLGAGFT